VFSGGRETTRALDLDLGCLFCEEGEEVLGEVGGEVFCLALALVPARFVDLSLSFSFFQFLGNQ